MTAAPNDSFREVIYKQLKPFKFCLDQKQALGIHLEAQGMKQSQDTIESLHGLLGRAAAHQPVI